VNLNGELVGINTASFNPRGSMAGNIGLGFAIPAKLARDVMSQLVATGEVRRGTLGLDTQDVDARIAPGLGLNEARGAVVTRVFAGSAAATAGLKAGDVIVGANGQRIDDRNSLRNFEGLQAVGSRVTLDVLRDGKPLQLRADLREQPRAMAGLELDPRLEGATFAELPASLRHPAPAACWWRRGRAAARPATACSRARGGGREWRLRRPARLPRQLHAPAKLVFVSSVAAGAADEMQ
jgi:hypothetical protein